MSSNSNAGGNRNNPRSPGMENENNENGNSQQGHPDGNGFFGAPTTPQRAQLRYRQVPMSVNAMDRLARAGPNPQWAQYQLLYPGIDNPPPAPQSAQYHRPLRQMIYTNNLWMTMGNSGPQKVQQIGSASTTRNAVHTQPSPSASLSVQQCQTVQTQQTLYLPQVRSQDPENGDYDAIIDSPPADEAQHQSLQQAQVFTQALLGAQNNQYGSAQGGHQQPSFQLQYTPRTQPHTPGQLAKNYQVQYGATRGQRATEYATLQPQYSSQAQPQAPPRLEQDNQLQHGVQPVRPASQNPFSQFFDDYPVPPTQNHRDPHYTPELSNPFTQPSSRLGYTQTSSGTYLTTPQAGYTPTSLVSGQFITVPSTPSISTFTTSSSLQQQPNFPFVGSGPALPPSVIPPQLPTSHPQPRPQSKNPLPLTNTAITLPPLISFFYKCPYIPPSLLAPCSYKAMTAHRYKIHMLTHIGARGVFPYFCLYPFCALNFHSKIVLRNHMRDCHNVTRCSTCLEVPQGQSIQQHESKCRKNRGGNEGKWVCKCWKKRFLCEGDLVQHVFMEHNFQNGWDEWLEDRE